MGPRKYFLDWLRVLAFGALVLFHVGMVYVTWPYNLKSPRLYPGLEWWMEATSPWRMALLFVISGVACRFLISKLGPGRFALDRLARLGVVIVTGMLLVNPLQVWVQLISQGDTSKSYFDFWLTSYLARDASLVKALGRPMPTWDHLWFIVYLLLYTMLFAAIWTVRTRFASRARAPLWLFFLLPALWMALANVAMATVAPFTHALFNDWAAHCKWLGLFVIGTMLASRDDFWISARDHRSSLAFITVVLLAVYLAARYDWLRSEQSLKPTIFFRCAEGAYGWCAVMTIAGLARQCLDRTSASLSYLNDVVLPVYVLHQPVMLGTAFLLFPLRLPIGVEATLLVIATGAGSLAIYHIAIRPWRPMRLLFGLKSHRTSSIRREGEACAATVADRS